MTGNFQLDPSVPGAAQANPLLDVQQNEYSKKNPEQQAAMMIQTVRSGYDPSDTGSPAGKVNGPSGLVGDSLSQAQLMILTYGMGASLGNFATVTIPDAILAAINNPANKGPEAFWNAGPAMAGIVSIPGVTPLVQVVNVVNPHTGKQFNGVLLLPPAA